MKFLFAALFSLFAICLSPRLEARTCRDIFETRAVGKFERLRQTVALQLPFVGKKEKSKLLRTLVARESGGSKFWQMRIAVNETVAVLHDRRLDPILETWLQRTPPSRDASFEKQNRIEQLRQYVYMSLSDNTSPDTPMRDGALQRLLGPEKLNPSDIPPMRYYLLGEFLKINRGICRHSALAMVVLLRAEGFHAEYMQGEISIDGVTANHAWTVATDRSGQKFILDAAVYLDRLLPVENKLDHAVGSMNGKPVEYLPLENVFNRTTPEYLAWRRIYSGTARPITDRDDHSVYFR